MGNFWPLRKKHQNLNIQMKDQNRLLLFENMEEKINNLQQIMTEKYSNLAQTYNLEIHNLRNQIQDLNQENEKTLSKIRNLQVLLDDKNNIISNLEHKMINLESNDEFLSTIDSQLNINS